MLENFETTVVVGLQYGDEAKGRLVHALANNPNIAMVVRFQGGANAGHTIFMKEKKIVLHLIPSGIPYSDKICVIGNGMVLDPEKLIGEIRGLKEAGFLNDNKQLRISNLAHITLPSHKDRDGKNEKALGKNKIGTTGRGIGPTYEDKVGRKWLRVQDLLCDFNELRSKLSCLSDYSWLNEKQTAIALMEYGKFLKPFICDTGHLVNLAVRQKKGIIFEGAQGTLLDIDHGTYPFVTSSNTMSGAACTGSGIGPTAIKNVLGVCKAYTTRVGSGPFPTELLDEIGLFLRENGLEKGATTGRDRRCGWLDLVALKYAVRVNGVTQLAITKLDVLSGLKNIQVCKSYKTLRQTGEGKHKFIQVRPDDPFTEFDTKSVTPIYQEFQGWTENLRHIRKFKDLPKAAREYLDYIEKHLEVPITLVSVGPEQNEYITR